MDISGTGVLFGGHPERYVSAYREKVAKLDDYQREWLGAVMRLSDVAGRLDAVLSAISAENDRDSVSDKRQLAALLFRRFREIAGYLESQRGDDWRDVAEKTAAWADGCGIGSSFPRPLSDIEYDGEEVNASVMAALRDMAQGARESA